jgi:hypothetical protein
MHEMQQSAHRRVAGLWHLALLWMVSLAAAGCPGSKVPTHGVFPIKVVALTSDKVGIPKAKVLINGKLLGQTDQFGTFVGTYPGKVREKIEIRVEGAGVDNFMTMSSRLNLRKTQHGYTPSEVKVEAFLPQPTPETPSDPVAVRADEGTTPTDPTPKVEPTQRTEPIRRAEPTPRARVVSDDPQPIRRPTPVRVDTDTTPKPLGRYRIRVVSNVSGIAVYKGKKLAGTIRVPEGIVSITHKDSSSSPSPVQIILKAKNRYAYKEGEVTREVTIDPSKEEYDLRVDFEKAPPYKIAAKANLGGIKVSIEKQNAEISDPATPANFEVTGRPRTLTVTFRPNDRKVKPRILKKKLPLEAGKYEYTVDAEFKAPEAPVAVAVREPQPRQPDPQPEPRQPDPQPETRQPDPQPEPRQPDPQPTEVRKTFSGKFTVSVASNAAGKVYKNRKMVASIAAGSNATVQHSDKSANPKTLVIEVRASDKNAFKTPTLKREVTLEAGKEEYSVEFQFEKRPGMVVRAKANVRGVKVLLNGKPQGEVVDPAQPVNCDYTGKPVRSLRVEFRSPNAKLYKPATIRKTISIKPDVFEYDVDAVFEEFDPGDSVVLQPSCFRGASGKKKTITLAAAPGTSFILKSSASRDCGGEQLGKAGKTGRIKVAMPPGFIRVIAAFPDSGNREKTFEVAGDPMTITFSKGGQQCNLTKIQAKIRNKIFLEEEEVACLRSVKPANPQFFSAQTSLARFYCQKKAYVNGKNILDQLHKNPANIFQPYNAMNLGIEYGRCKEYDRALTLLKRAELNANRFAAADRYSNQKSLYKALSALYEQRYYKRKNITDLRSSLKAMERLSDIARSDDSSERDDARQQVTRLKGLLSQRGGLED